MKTIVWEVSSKEEQPLFILYLYELTKKQMRRKKPLIRPDGVPAPALRSPLVNILTTGKLQSAKNSNSIKDTKKNAF